MYGYNVFHDDIMKNLIYNVKKGEHRHAYLFTGPKGVGRHLAAKLFAAALCCTSEKRQPCNECHACIGTKNDTNPDIVHIKPKEKKSITVEQAREIVADAYIKPLESANKVYIIDDAYDLNEATQNCLLKILEEPPEYVVFIIIAESEVQLLQTVLSRCTTIHFPTVTDDVIKKYIEENYPDSYDKSDLLISLSNGIPGEVDKILSDPDYYDLRSESFKKLISLMSEHKISAYTISEFLEDHKDDAEKIIDFWQSFLRDILIISEGGDKLIWNKDMQEEIKKIAFSIKPEFCVVALEQTILAKTMLRKYVNLHSLSLNLSFSIKKRLYKK